MDGKGALHTHPVRRLADREHLAAAAAAAPDHGSLEDLDALLVALDHAHVHPHGVARLEGRDVLAELLRLDAVDRIHGNPLLLAVVAQPVKDRSEEHTSELQSLTNLVCRLLLEKKNKK